MDPLIDQRSMLHCYIKEVSRMTECTYIYDRLTPLPTDDRSMLHHYTFPCQLTIDPCYTITPPLPIDHRSMQHHYTHKSHIPPFETVIDDRSIISRHMCSVRAHAKWSAELGQCAHLLKWSQ